MKKIINQLNKTLEIKEELILKTKDENELLILIAAYVQELINTDFEHLLYILYKIDVGEKKVKTALLNNSPENAHLIIANMILKREKEKIVSREKYSSKNTETDWIF